MWPFNEKAKSLVKLQAPDEEDGFVDLVFSIKEFSIHNSYYEIRVENEYKNQIIGFGLQILKGMKPGVVGSEIDNSAFYKKSIKLISIGEKSDKFLSSISEVYKIPTTKANLVKNIELTSFALEGNPTDLEHSHINFKVFHDVPEQDRYWEMYFHIDVSKKEVQLHEKDLEYRKPIITTLSE